MKKQSKWNLTYFNENTVKPVWSDHLYNKIEYLWLIQ